MVLAQVLMTVAIFLLIVCYSDVYALDPGHPATNNQLVLCLLTFLFILQCGFFAFIALTLLVGGSDMARVNEGSHSFTCHPDVYPQVE